MNLITHPSIGTPWPEQGGVLGAIMRGAVVDGIEQPNWAIIVPTAPALSIESIQWGEYGRDIPGTASLRDGLANTIAMAEAGCDIAKRLRMLEHEGHADWYLGARDEMRILAANVPELFKADDWYWTSTQGSRYGAWIQAFEHGSSSDDVKGAHCRAVALRRFLLPSAL